MVNVAPGQHAGENLYLPHLGTEVEGVMIEPHEDGRITYIAYDVALDALTNDATFSPQHFDLRLLDKKYAHAGDVEEGFSKDYVLPSGGRLYGDNIEKIDSRSQAAVPAKLLEFAFPATLSPSEAGRLSLASLRWVSASTMGKRIYASGDSRSPLDTSGLRLEFQSNRLHWECDQGETPDPNFRIGFHQTLSIPDSTDRGQLISDARLLFSSMGVVVGEGSYQGDMLVRNDRAQRMALGFHVGDSGSHKMDWAVKKDESYLDDGGELIIHSRRIELRCNDFPTSDNAALLSNGITMLGVALHVNGCAPDVSDLVDDLTSDGIHSSSELFAFFGGNVTDLYSGEMADKIQQRYCDAAREFVTRITDPLIKTSCEGVVSLWQRSIEENRQYLRTGQVPDHPVAGWLHAAGASNYNILNQTDKRPDECPFRNYEEGLSQGDSFAFHRPPTTSNAYFRTLLRSALKDDEVRGYREYWNSVSLSPKRLEGDAYGFDAERRTEFVMPMDSEIGTAQWVKQEFGTFKPTKEQLVGWYDDRVAEQYAKKSLGEEMGQITPSLGPGRAGNYGDVQHQIPPVESPGL